MPLLQNKAQAITQSAKQEVVMGIQTKLMAMVLAVVLAIAGYQYWQMSVLEKQADILIANNSVLDAAAKQILRMAQPFAPFSDELRERTDQIVIIRTWDFKSNRLTTESGIR